MRLNLTYRSSFRYTIITVSLLWLLSTAGLCGDIDYRLESDIVESADLEISEVLSLTSELNRNVISEVEQTLNDYGYFNGAVRSQNGDDLLIVPGDRFKIGDLYFEGLEIISPYRAQEIVDIREGDYYQMELIENSLNMLFKYYLERGYLKAKFEYEAVVVSEVEGIVDIIISVDSGEEFMLEELDFVGNQFFTDREVVRVLDLELNETVDMSEVYKSIDDLREEYVREGFTEVDVGVLKMDFEDKFLSLIIYIDEMERIVINRIYISGNYKTRDEVILRECKLTPGEVYRTEDLYSTEHKLKRLKLFRVTPDIQLDDDGNVTIEVDEGRYVNIFGGVGYKPSSEVSSGGLIGEFRGDFLNIGGSARKLNLRWRGYGGDEVFTSVRYREPWLLGKDVFFDTEFTFERREDYRKYDVKGGIGVHTGDYFELEVGGGFSRIERLGGYFNSHEYLYAGEVIDTTGYSYFPRSGLILKSEQEFGVMRRDDPSSGRDSEVKLELDFEKFTGLHENLVLYFRLLGKIIFLKNSALYRSELFYLGGANNLRGYREYSFPAQRLALGTLELRVPIYDETYLYGFYDEGYHYLRSKRIEEGFHRGYGVGLSLGTGIGPLRLEYAIGSGGITDGVIHLSIGSYY